MRLKEITSGQQRLLRELTARISNRLEAAFAELPDADGPNVGVTLHERNRSATMELPGLLLVRAGGYSHFQRSAGQSTSVNVQIIEGYGYRSR